MSNAKNSLTLRQPKSAQINIIKVQENAFIFEYKNRDNL